MKTNLLRAIFISVLLLTQAATQGLRADYERANGLKAKYESVALDIAGPATWIGNSNRFWYRKLSKGVYEYIIFDAQDFTEAAGL